MRIALVVALAMTSATAHADKPFLREAPTPDQVLANVEATYAKATQVTATFNQKHTNVTFGTETPTRGTIAIERPNKIAWDYIDKKNNPGNSFVSDGKLVRFIDRKNKRVMEGAAMAAELPAAISFLTGAGTLAKEFDVGPVRDKTMLVPGVILIRLTPKAVSASYKSIVLVVDPNTWRVTKTIVNAPSGDTNEFEFSSVDLAPKLDAKRFAFDPKQFPNFDIVKPKPVVQTTPKPVPVKPTK